MVSCFSKCELKTLNAPVQNRHKSKPVVDAPIPPEPSRLDVVLTNGRIVRIAGDAPDATIVRLIRVAEAA